MPDTANGGLYYPLTKMNFIVSIGEGGGDMAAFNEVTGIESTVDVIEFRQGNSHSLAPVKIQGLVKHGNVTLRMGYVRNQEFKNWIIQCVSEHRGAATPRKNVSIELIDISEGSPDSVESTPSADGVVWVLSNAWVTKYNGADLNASTSEVAIESVELAYEDLTIPN